MYNNSYKNIFFFGAGAECDYGLPIGGEFVVDTMITKKKELYNKLEQLYKDSNIKYEQNFIFKSNSTTLAKLLYDSYVNSNLKIEIENSKSDDQENIIYQIYKDVQESNLYEDNIKKIKENLNHSNPINDKRIFDCLVDKKERSNYQLVNKFCESIKYYGILEKDFSYLLNYSEYSYRTSRLINYFWSCYFSILIPYLESLDGKALVNPYDALFKLTNNKTYYFNEKLKDLEEANISDFYMYNKKNNKYEKGESYYSLISKKYAISSCAITTNYTFFVKKAFKKSIYLSGRLDLFENIDSFLISKEFSSKSIPFLYTQAPIKPLLSSQIISEYSDAINLLKNSENIFIIGYSFCDEDNHIKTIFKEISNFRKENNKKKIIYCDYKSTSNEKLRIFLKKNDFIIKPYFSKEELLNILDYYQSN